ncbi:hypothetical protein E1264_32265 [Actinomadura sp. KC216]|uniref:hypothetical protein n=1 Tax=Actinomadura sp. KC216 TaxID=2530370 RepID=UPI0010493D07|nr:hypothetical protein [Actinomadura sp. KC216]TDB81728.1 hypothetical protein E1264_32265 [Actinomadura sp. KC216]
MTTTQAAVAAPPRILGYLAPLGPLAMAGWALALPYQLADEPAVWIPKAAAATGRLQIAMAMLLLFALTSLAGALIIGLRAREASRRIGTTGLVLTFLGFSAVSFGASGYAAAAVASHDTVNDVAVTERILKELDGFIAPMLAGSLFVPLMALGVILMGVAFWRDRTVPRWAAATMIAAFPVILIGGYASTLINALGWLLLATSFGSAGSTHVRT